jgi:hypothetical protein
MRYTLPIALFAFLLLHGCGEELATEPPRPSDDLEWVVRIELSGGHVCTGVVLSEHWILTAGHCLQVASDDHITVVRDVFGMRTLIYDGAAQLLLHPDYVEIGQLAHRWHDIGLLGLSEGSVDAGERAHFSGLTRTFALLWRGDHLLYSLGYGQLPDPETGECSDQLGSKKRYDGLGFIEVTGPLFANALGVELDGRADALCDGDSGAPLLFDLEGDPNVFAVFSGRAEYRTIHYGTLAGPKIDWFESATASSNAPVACREVGDDSWACFE